MLNTNYPIQAQQVADFQRDGHVYLPELISPEALKPYRDSIVQWADDFRKKQKPMSERDTYGKAFLQMMNLWEEDPNIKEFVFAKRFGQVAADLLGVEKVRLYHDQALFKEAGGGHTPWHQDQYYWPLSNAKTVTMWMPLVDITEEMGMLTFASGTQHVKLPPMPISDKSEETIASFEEALKNKLPCIALSAGGTIEAMAKEHGVPHVKLPIPFENFQPRVGTGYFFGAMFQILVNLGLVPDTTAILLEESATLQKHMEALEEQGRALAKQLVGKTPVIYSTAKYKSVAMVWKIKLNENAKTPAFWNFFPELNHNEMVGWTLPQGQFIVLMLRDTTAHPQVLKRFEVTAELLRNKGVEVVILDMEGTSVYSKVFTSIALGDLASYYLALEYGQDPTPVAMVEEIGRAHV